MLINSVLHAIFDQRNCIPGGGNTPYQTPKPNAMGTSNLASGLMFIKVFQKNRFVVDDVTALFSKMTSFFFNDANGGWNFVPFFN